MNKAFAIIDRAAELLVAVIFASMCVVGFLQVFNRFLGLSMALVVLAAYNPPRWLRPLVATPEDG